MKPRNKIEQEVVNLSHKLGEIGKRDNARLLRNTYGSCKYEDMYNRCYAVINQSYKGWQVLRYFRIDRHGKRDISDCTWEVFQLWNKVGEKQILIARQRAFHYYVDTFLLSSPMEIRQNPQYSKSWLHFTDVGFSYMYDKSVNGTYKYCDSLIPTNERKQWYRFLSVDKFAETILKQRHELAEYMLTNNILDKEYMQAIRIMFRHNYVPMNEGHTAYNLYFDMLQNMKYIGCDLSNPHFVCPENLLHTHDWAMQAATALRDKEESAADRVAELNRIKQDIACDEEYVKAHSCFFGMNISDDLISCHVLQSVQEFYEEGTAMHHCVYANKYYQKPNSLILSARIDNKRIETVEVDLREMKVVQCYGACDKYTIYHDRIVNLVNGSMNTIKQYMNNNKQLAV
jgi:hypothetical protein